MESDDDLVRDEFYSTLASHDTQDGQLDSQGPRTSDNFDRQGFEIRKQSRVKPSKNPTHDKKYWGKRTSRKKLEKLNEMPVSKVNVQMIDSSEVGFSDVDSEGELDEDESERVERKRANRKIDESGSDWADVDDADRDAPKSKKKRKVQKVQSEKQVEVDSSVEDHSESLDDLDSEGSYVAKDFERNDHEIDTEQESEAVDDDDDDAGNENDNYDDDNLSAHDSGNWEDLESENEPKLSGKNKIKKSSMKSSRSQKGQSRTSAITFFSDASSKQQGSTQITDAQKGAALKKQLSMWEKYFQLRVLLQTALQSANEIHPSSLESIDTECLEYDETLEKLSSLSEKFLTIAEQSLKCLQFNTTLNDYNSLNFEEKLTELNSVLMNEGPDLMQFWHDKIMLSMGKHSQSTASFSTSSKNAMTAQIEGVLADRQRLLKRTRAPRVEYKSSNPTSEISDGEIYDEYDFYQSLVKDLISSRTAATGQYLTNQSDVALRLKSVKSITTQLVRKHKSIVYDIHAKLVGFMAPRSMAADWRDDAIDALTLSVFNS